MHSIERITAVTAVNNNYVLPLAVMMRSLADTLPANVFLDFRILTTGLHKANRKRLDKCLTGMRINLHEVRVDPSSLRGVKVDGHVSLETYFRLLTPSVLNDADRVLYLDADLIVRHSLLELYREPLNGAHLLAVPNACKRSAFFSSERGVPAYSRLGIPGSTPTFNAGVMVLDLERWRQTNVANLILKYLNDYKSQVLWWDQDGLNAILHANWRPLPAKWNVMANHFARMQNWEDSVLDAATFEEIKHDPGIIHYSSPLKPWMPNYCGPFVKHWQHVFTGIAPYFEGEERQVIS